MRLKRHKKAFFSDDTITAIASPLGEGGVGVIRISGDKSLSILKKIFIKAAKNKIFKTHFLVYGQVVDPRSKIALDKGLAVYMKAPNSYTGEDVVEINLHSSIPVLRQTLALIIEGGARLAERGEFTKRAFLNGKIDLSQAEAVIDLIKAKTSFSASLAAGQMNGWLSKDIALVRDNLLSVLTEIEASIDFYEDVKAVPVKKINTIVNRATIKIKKLLSTNNLGKIIREGALVAIIGRPNVGKSSLLNAFLKEERAIVTGEPGTTRDTLEESINVFGMPVRIVDTAGLRRAKGQAEAIGINRVHKLLNNADLVLLVVDMSKPEQREDRALVLKCVDKNLILVFNKIDKKLRLVPKQLKKLAPQAKAVKVSALYGDGMVELEKMIHKSLLGGFSADTAKVCINSRHKQCLIRAEKELVAVLECLKKKLPVDLVAINLKEAIMALGEVTGEVITEEILTKIFNSFCVGK